MRTKLQPGETVVLIVKRHWVILAKPLICFCATFLMPVIGRYNLLGFGPLFKSLFQLVLIGTGSYLFYALLDRKYDLWVVTSNRLIDEWGIITNNAKENPLDKINDIEIKQTVLGRILDYADISVQTAAEKGETFVTYVEKPKLLKDMIANRKALVNSGDNTPPKHEIEAKETQPYTLILAESIRPPYSIACPCCRCSILIDSVKSILTPVSPLSPKSFETMNLEDPETSAEENLVSKLHQEKVTACKKKDHRQPPTVLNPKAWEKPR